MGGVGIEIDVAGLEKALGVVDRLAIFGREQLLAEIGTEGESQTRRRIDEEKTAPDGTPWKSNREGGSILLRSGDHLRNSLAFEVAGDVVRWGASWQFAHVHQHGATIRPKSKAALSFVSGGRRRSAKMVIIPARPFVGLSKDNETGIDRVVTDFLGRLAR